MMVNHHPISFFHFINVCRQDLAFNPSFAVAIPTFKVFEANNPSNGPCNMCLDIGYCKTNGPGMIENEDPAVPNFLPSRTGRPPGMNTVDIVLMCPDFFQFFYVEVFKGTVELVIGFDKLFFFKSGHFKPSEDLSFFIKPFVNRSISPIPAKRVKLHKGTKSPRE